MTPKLTLIIRIISYTTLTIFLIWFAFTAVSFCVAVGYAQSSFDYWYQMQDERMDKLSADYLNGTAPKLDERDFCGFDLDAALESGSKINELGYLATHNSYKCGVSKAAHVFYNYAIPLFCGKLYDYEFDSLTEQLNYGIRSIEIDITKMMTDDGFTLACVHNAVLEINSSIIDFKQGLEELKLWSDYNPDHLPVMILIEPKGGFGSKYKSMDAEAMQLFDDTIAQVLGDSLLTPADVLGSYENFAAVRNANAYPEIKDALGKFMFLWHGTSVLDTYVERDLSMRTQKAFIALAGKGLDFSKYYRDEYYTDKALFVLFNGPEKGEKYIREFVGEKNFIVRTRLDEFALVSESQRTAGIRSGAQIMSTDYPPASVDRYGYTCKLTPDGKTVVFRSRVTA